MKEFLSHKNVPFTERNISDDDAARDEFIAKGFLSVPVTEVDGVAVLGFDPKRLGELIGA